jgi:sugar phosphate isomerase/epimerase
VFKQTSKRIGLSLDTAWAIDARQDPVAMAEKFADRLYGIHIKDFIYERVRKPVDVVAGEGLLELPAFLKKLKEIDFNGYCVLEYEADVDNPVPALKNCAEKVKREAANV